MQHKKGFNQIIPKTLIVRAQENDLAAFEEIYNLLYIPSFNLAYRICGRKEVAEDLAHDAFLKIMKNIIYFKHNGSFSGWCRQIITRESVNYLKKDSKLMFADELVVENIEEGKDLFVENWLDSFIDLETLLSQLPDIARTVLWLHEVEGLSHKEISMLFDKSTSFSKVTLQRAFIKLRKLVLDSKIQLEKCNAFK